MRALAAWCFRHRRIVVVAWIAALVGLSAISQSVGSTYKDSFSLPGTQSFEALTLLQHAAPVASGDREQIVVAVKLAQLREVPAAERSAEGAHEDEDDLVAAEVLAEPDSAAAGAFEAEVGRLGADGDALRFDRHQSCVTSARLPVADERTPCSRVSMPPFVCRGRAEHDSAGGVLHAIRSFGLIRRMAQP
jgi:hypothetical protein